MGAFKDFLDTVRATVAGLIPLGGTLNPVSEGVAIAFSQNIKGNCFVVPTLEALADIPYEILQLDMEVIVSEHERPGPITFERTKFFLIQLPAEGTKVSDIPGYNIGDFWEEIEAGDGEPGEDGDNGWTILWGLEADGPGRVVERFVDYIGGSGTPPAAPVPPLIYRGVTGFVGKSNAVNVMGPKGDQGDPASNKPTLYETVGQRRNTPPTSLAINGPAGTFFFASNSLTVTNTWNQPRTVIIFGEVQFSNVSGSVSWVVRLLSKPDNLWNIGDMPDPMDEQYGRQDFVNAPAYQSGHKILVRGKDILAPNETRYYRLAATKSNGGNSFYELGFIEAIGI